MQRLSLASEIAAALIIGLLLPGVARAENAAIQRIVLLRHGEKPPSGLGQLNCQGLNRALALPAIIEKQFGKPEAIFAPDPAQAVNDNGQFYYIRPLATVEPTAIFFGLPVDASIGVFNLDALRQKLEAPPYSNSLVVVAWEGSAIPRLARVLLSDHGGNPSVVPDWKGNEDFDTIYLVQITRGSDGRSSVTFNQEHEGLDGQSTVCPAPTRP